MARTERKRTLFENYVFITRPHPHPPTHTHQPALIGYCDSMNAFLSVFFFFLFFCPRGYTCITITLTIDTNSPEKTLQTKIRVYIICKSFSSFSVIHTGNKSEWINYLLRKYFSRQNISYLKYFSYFFLGNRLRYFMQIVSSGDSLQEMSKSIF